MPSRKTLSRADFSTVLEKNTALASPHFSLRFRKVPGGTGACAVVVSKKVAKRSVDRHLLKRRVREVTGHVGAKEGAVIIYARLGALDLPFKALKEELSTLLSRIPRS